MMGMKNSTESTGWKDIFKAVLEWVLWSLFGLSYSNSGNDALISTVVYPLAVCNTLRSEEKERPDVDKSEETVSPQEKYEGEGNTALNPITLQSHPPHQNPPNY